MRSQIGESIEELHRKIDVATHSKQSVIKGYPSQIERISIHTDYLFIKINFFLSLSSLSFNKRCDHGIITQITKMSFYDFYVKTSLKDLVTNFLFTSDCPDIEIRFCCADEPNTSPEDVTLVTYGLFAGDASACDWGDFSSIDTPTDGIDNELLSAHNLVSDADFCSDVHAIQVKDQLQHKHFLIIF
jgi:hypothetical protein